MFTPALRPFSGHLLEIFQGRQHHLRPLGVGAVTASRPTGKVRVETKSGQWPAKRFSRKDAKGAKLDETRRNLISMPTVRSISLVRFGVLSIAGMPFVVNVIVYSGTTTKANSPVVPILG